MRLDEGAPGAAQAWPEDEPAGIEVIEVGPDHGE
jgi:hypothetical protein